MARGNGSGSEEPKMSRASVQAAVQAALAICATCSHERGGHGPDDGPCSKTWMAGEEGKTEVSCRCAEYWPRREDLEDGMRVVEYAVSLSGGTKLQLDRRLTGEFWDGLRQGRDLVVLARYSVSGKAFREKDLTLLETRKLRLAQLYFLRPRDLEQMEESQAILDAFGNEVDPETGEILDADE